MAQGLAGPLGSLHSSPGGTKVRQGHLEAQRGSLIFFTALVCKYPSPAASTLAQKDRISGSEATFLSINPRHTHPGLMQKPSQDAPTDRHLGVALRMGCSFPDTPSRHQVCGALSTLRGVGAEEPCLLYGGLVWPGPGPPAQGFWALAYIPSGASEQLGQPAAGGHSGGSELLRAWTVLSRGPEGQAQCPVHPRSPVPPRRLQDPKLSAFPGPGSAWLSSTQPAVPGPSCSGKF